MRTLQEEDIADIRFQEQGDHPPLVPVVAQDAATGAVLMLAWADQKALEATLKTGTMHYYSRTRARLWKKGETSGHTQRLVSIWADCDWDALVAQVEQTGPACHTNAPTCFHKEDDTHAQAGGILGHLQAVIRQRDEKRPDGSHTTRLLEDENLRLKKIQEEAGELLVALAKDQKDGIREETADLVYHVLVGLQGAGVRVEEVLQTLAKRRS